MYKCMEYENHFLGPITTHHAFEQSGNIVNIRIGLQVVLKKKVCESMSGRICMYVCMSMYVYACVCMSV